MHDVSGNVTGLVGGPTLGLLINELLAGLLGDEVRWEMADLGKLEPTDSPISYSETISIERRIYWRRLIVVSAIPKTSRHNAQEVEEQD